MKFKTGDLVRVNKNLTLGEAFGAGANNYNVLISSMFQGMWEICPVGGIADDGRLLLFNELMNPILFEKGLLQKKDMDYINVMMEPLNKSTIKYIKKVKEGCNKYKIEISTKKNGTWATGTFKKDEMFCYLKVDVEYTLSDLWLDKKGDI